MSRTHYSGPVKSTDGFEIGAVGTNTTIIDSSGNLYQAGTQITATAAEVNAVADVSGRLITLDATTLSVTAATHAERIILMSHTAAASTATLPAAAGTGNKYTFVVGAVNTNNHVIKVADATDVMYGNIITNSTDDTPDLAQPWPTAADSDTITLNGTTTGGVAIGDYVELIDIATNKWLVRGVTTTSGAEATPFSATVA